MLKNRSCAAFFYKICMIMGLLMCLIRLTYYRFWVWLVFHILGGRSMYYEMEREFSYNIDHVIDDQNPLHLYFMSYQQQQNRKCIYCIIQYQNLLTIKLLHFHQSSVTEKVSAVALYKLADFSKKVHFWMIIKLLKSLDCQKDVKLFFLKFEHHFPFHMTADFLDKVSLY